MTTSKIFVFIALILLPTLSLHPIEEEIDQNLVDRYKTGDLQNQREKHANWWKKQVSKVFGTKITDKEHNAAKEAQEQLKDEEVDRLTNNYQDTADILKDKTLRHHFFKFKRFELAERAQKNILEKIKKENQNQLFNRLTNNENPDDVLKLALLVEDIKDLPKGLQKAVTQIFLKDPSNFPNKNIYDLELNNNTIKILFENNKLEFISDIQIEEYLASVKTFFDKSKNNPNVDQEEVEQYITALEKLTTIKDRIYDKVFFEGKIYSYIDVLIGIQNSLS